MKKWTVSKRRAYMRAYRRKNKSKIAKYFKKYRRDNFETLAKRDAAYAFKHHARIAKRLARWRRANRNKISAYNKVYRGTIVGRHKQMLSRHRRQLLPQGVSGRPLSLKDHEAKLYFADGRERRCWYCLGPVSKAGGGLDRLNNSITYTATNTVPACCGCNTRRADNRTVQETRDHFKPMRDAAHNQGDL